MSQEDQRSRPSPAVQDYLKAIYRVCEDTGRSSVATSEVAEALAVTAPSASAMLKKMSQLGFVAPTERRGAVELTSSGRTAALEVIRHHRLLETYLVTRLGVPWDQVHHEAEILEHHLSEELEARIAEALGHPERDPHGDPIPTLGGEVAETATDLLAELADGDRATVSRVGDQDPAVLRYLAEQGLVPDVEVEMIGHSPDAGSLRIRVGGGDILEVSRDAARVVRVTPVP